MNDIEDSIRDDISVPGNTASQPYRLPFHSRIFRVHHHIRTTNEKAYQPNIIAIGPYHSGTHNYLQMMEEYKQHYLHLLLKRNNQQVETYVDALKSLEGEVRECYAEPLEHNAGQLVNMMLLDGCFIVELVRKFSYPWLREKNDPIFQMGWILNSLKRDLLLFENQIPFFVLCKLFDITKDPKQDETFSYLARMFFMDLLPGDARKDDDNRDLPCESLHLLGLVHMNCLPLFRSRKKLTLRPFCSIIQLTLLLFRSRKRLTKGIDKKEEKETGSVRERLQNYKYIHCATDLKEAGINFQKCKGNLFDISFENGTLMIPPLIIEDRTESFLRNLIVLEQYCQGNPSFVTDYAKFMDCLINTPRDVGTLRRRNIINNWLGDDEAVSNMFNKMMESVVDPGEWFHYSHVFDEVNRYYNERQHRWMAILWRKYLNSPWAIISISAAIVLLLLTFLQTAFTIMS